MTTTPIDLFDRALRFYPDGRVHESDHRMTTGADSWQLAVFHAETNADLHADYWECHPSSEEAVYCVSGALHIYLRPEQADEAETEIRLTAGTAFVIPRDRWHRLELDQPSDLMSVGLREGTTREPVAT